MKEQWKVYIKGVPGRGDEVRQALIDLGGKVYNDFNFNLPGYLYFMNHHGEIKYTKESCDIGKIIMDNYRELHLKGKWIDGDVLISKDGGLFCIFRRYEPDSFFSVSLEVSDRFCNEYSKGLIFFMGCYRLATPSEVDHFQELLHEYGKEWDAEKKQLVNWRWKPKKGESFYMIDEYGRIDTRINDSVYPGYLIEYGNCFRTREEAEAMAKKIKKLLKGD